MRALVHLTVVCLALSATLRLGAQDTASVAVGTRLRIRPTSSAPWQYGTFGGVRADSLLFTKAKPDTVLLYHVPAIDAIEIRGAIPGARHRHAGRGAAVGAVGGAALLVWGVRHCEATSRNNDGPPCALGYAGLPFAAGGGLFAGAIVGAGLPARGWKRVTVIVQRK
jgi:hypothetical protein